MARHDDNFEREDAPERGDEFEVRGEEIDADRLFAASEAVVLAVSELAAAGVERCPYPPSLLGTPDQPECLADFTRHELEEATAFLVRMGVLAQHPRRGQTNA
ncbi:MAG: hypothetical protein RBS39_01585 [Phycisphaerales bacterium]|jgi:hypothetical protein|nr:hypothetical protein [Phycisphaerales bacterium]